MYNDFEVKVNTAALSWQYEDNIHNPDPRDLVCWLVAENRRLQGVIATLQRKLAAKRKRHKTKTRKKNRLAPFRRGRNYPDQQDQAEQKMLVVAKPPAPPPQPLELARLVRMDWLLFGQEREEKKLDVRPLDETRLLRMEWLLFGHAVTRAPPPEPRPLREDVTRVLGTMIRCHVQRISYYVHPPSVNSGGYSRDGVRIYSHDDELFMLRNLPEDFMSQVWSDMGCPNAVEDGSGYKQWTIVRAKAKKKKKRRKPRKRRQ